MELDARQVVWHSEDAALFREFLNSKTGAKLLLALAESAPLLLAGGDVNAVLIRNGELRGFQIALRELQTLANPPTQTAPLPEAYPSLTDDAQWNDEQKIE